MGSSRICLFVSVFALTRANHQGHQAITRHRSKQERRCTSVLWPAFVQPKPRSTTHGSKTWPRHGTNGLGRSVPLLRSAPTFTGRQPGRSTRQQAPQAAGVSRIQDGFRQLHEPSLRSNDPFIGVCTSAVDGGECCVRKATPHPAANDIKPFRLPGHGHSLSPYTQ